MDPAGVLPTLGCRGAYYAQMFKSGFPQRQLRALGNVGAWMVHSIGEIFGCNAWFYYWYQVLAARTATGDVALSKFITRTSDGAFWNSPTLPLLLQIEVPLSFCWGENDDIMPLHQLSMLKKLSRGSWRSVVVAGSGHNPVGPDVCKFLASIARDQEGDEQPERPLHVADTLLRDKQWAREYASTFSPANTSALIEELYSNILLVADQGREPATAPQNGL